MSIISFYAGKKKQFSQKKKYRGKYYYAFLPVMLCFSLFLLYRDKNLKCYHHSHPLSVGVGTYCMWSYVVENIFEMLSDLNKKKTTFWV